MLRTFSKYIICLLEHEVNVVGAECELVHNLRSRRSRREDERKSEANQDVGEVLVVASPLSRRHADQLLKPLIVYRGLRKALL